MKAIRNFSRLIIAPVFIFSGFVKAIDPLGSTYKFTDYFEAFGLEFLTPLALVLAVLLSTTELVIGLNLLLGVLVRTTSWFLLVFMSFFTIITLILAINNPVTDCGCFGDALILTNWQTFWKNIVFFVPTLVVFYGRKRFRPMVPIGVEWGVSLLFIAIAVILSVHSYRNLPVLDFRPYEVGTDIPSDMTIPDGAAIDEYETIFVYAKDGEEQEFAIENIPYEDTAWKYVDRKTELIKKGYEPPIHDFTIATYEGVDITDSVLSNPGYSLLIISHDLEKANVQALEKINVLAEQVQKSDVSVYGMSASSSKIAESVLGDSSLNFNFHTTDEITLKTIVRSNPGVVLLKKGVVVGKWHYNNLPDVSDFKKGALLTSINYYKNRTNKYVVGFYLLLLVSILSVLTILLKENK